MSNKAAVTLRSTATMAASSSFGLRQATVALIWLAATMAMIAIMGGLLIGPIVGRLICSAIVLVLAIVLHLSLRPSKPPPAPARAAVQERPSDVIDRVHRQILGTGAAGATALRR